MGVLQIGHLLVLLRTLGLHPLQMHRWLQGSISVLAYSHRQMMHSLPSSLL
jgi:cellulose synthase/poly-beta-1,6-N-acetylglucosamine synthase-like glycosyltransferase